jgi:hypothetical protein
MGEYCATNGIYFPRGERRERRALQLEMGAIEAWEWESLTVRR